MRTDAEPIWMHPIFRGQEIPGIIAQERVDAARFGEASDGQGNARVLPPSTLKAIGVFCFVLRFCGCGVVEGKGAFGRCSRSTGLQPAITVRYVELMDSL
jgi:hypothetical protein